MPDIPPARPSRVELDERIEAFVQATKADIRFGFSSAFYRQSEDFIAMPALGTFTVHASPPDHVAEGRVYMKYPPLRYLGIRVSRIA
jgi:hypothetical protein